MSGGSFEYVCDDVTDERILNASPKLKAVEEYLRMYGKHDIADEVLRFRLDVETHQRILMAMGARIAPLLKAAEWWASGDWGEDDTDSTWQEFLQGNRARSGDDDTQA